MNDIHAIKRSLKKKLDTLTDGCGQAYLLFYEAKYTGDLIEVQVGEMDEVNLNKLISIMDSCVLPNEYYIDSIQFSVELKQMMVEIRKGDKQVAENFNMLRSEICSADGQASSQMGFPSEITTAIMKMSPSDRTTGNEIIRRIYSQLKDVIDRHCILKVTPRADDYIIKFFFTKDAILSNSDIKILTHTCKNVEVITEMPPKLQIVLDKTVKSI